ncbi:MAG: RNA-binding protein [Thermodesulfobacteriota bacterium]
MNIYVGNLPWDLSEEDLREAFAAFGEVETAKIVTDRETGRARGFGFVEMSNKDEGTAAISGLNEKDLKGRAIKVNEARPRTENRRPGGGGGGFGGGGYGGGGGGRRY